MRYLPRSAPQFPRAALRAMFLASALAASARDAPPPLYQDRSDLLHYLDESGASHPVATPEDWAKRAAHILASMELVMGPLPEPAALPLEVELLGAESLRHYERRHVRFQVEDGDRLPAWLLVPHGIAPGERRPGIICLPGSSEPGKDRPAGLDAAAGMAYAHELAERGNVCLVLDYPLLHSREYQTDPYALGYASATMKGIVNHRRGVDLLQSLDQVDGGAIGVIGHSLGGHNALFLAAFDERVKAVVSSCGFNTFAKHRGGDVSAWSSRYYMPRIRTDHGDDPARIPFDFTEVLAALAPRAVFVNAPLHDAPDFEVSGVRDCLDAALPVYQRVFQAGERLEARHPDAGHAFPAAERLAAYDFLDRHLLPPGPSPDLDRGLLALWPLQGDAGESLGGAGETRVAGAVDFAAPGGAAFDGRGAELSVDPGILAEALGRGDFTLSLWLRAPSADDVPGDLLSWRDPARRKGWLLSLKTSPGVTTSEPNRRHLQFSIDDGREQPWVDRGRPGAALMAFAFAVHEGMLYAGTCEPDTGQSGHVYRHAGGQRWIDCGAPDASNSVTALIVHQGQLHAGTGRYRVAGSSLPESPNETPGGRVFRYAGGDRWEAIGQLPETEAIGGFAVFGGKLHASSLYRPAGLFRHEGGAEWTSLPVPMGPARDGSGMEPKRVEALAAHDGRLYASTYDGGHVYRWDGEEWADLGLIGENTQTYSFVPSEGRLLVGTWPSGKVYRLEQDDTWTDLGRLGEELEVMGMAVHHGRLVAGTLPLAEVHEYRGDERWERLARLDQTPDVKYRRAWTMGEHDGQVFCSTLPSGHVYSWEAGRGVDWGHPLSEGWHHLAATRSARRLELHLDGTLVARRELGEGEPFDLGHGEPLRIGGGPNDSFLGQLREVRIYGRALEREEIRELAEQGR